MATMADKSAMDIEVTEDCPIKQVAATVPRTDDTTLPVLTFRVWFMGLIAVGMLSVQSQFFWYRENPLSISSIAAMIVAVPIGHFMAKVLPTRKFLQGTRFEFTLNPGPFNVKEHVLITIFANAATGGIYATHILSAVKLFYKRPLPVLPALLVMFTTQVLGYGWAGIFRKHLIESPQMWWPSILVQVSLFRALHEKDKRPKGGLNRTQFFLICMACGFAYYVLPGYMFMLLTSVSWICWIAPKSVLVHQLGSGQSGLGIAALGFDWSTISSYLGSPLASPWFASANVALGFFLIMYIMTPLCYWLNLFNAKHFPIYSQDLFKINGQEYDVDAVINSNFELDKIAYGREGSLYMSTFFAITYGLGFATVTATLVHVLLFNGSEIWSLTRNAFREDRMKDIHTKLMEKYKKVPTWWFLTLLGLNIVLVIFTCEYYNATLQLRWWGVLLACAIAFIFTLPIGIIQATTNQQPGLNIITEYVIGYAYPGRPVANMCFKVYGYVSMMQALFFLQDFKLGHYMKIPPRSMFCVQLVGTVLSVLIYTGTAWWLMGAIPHLCDTKLLPPGSPWKCNMDRVFYDASVIWGLIGPRRIFGELGVYPTVNWFFLAGAVSPLLVWIAARTFPKHKWIGLINMPVLLGATAMMPPASAVNYTSWLIVAFIFGFIIFRRYPKWWERHTYVLSGGLEAGTAFCGILLWLALGNVSLSWWGNNGEHCPLASCPTAKGINVDGCPANL